MTLFAAVVAATKTVAATSKRTEKKEALADLLGGLDRDEIEIVVGFLVGEVRQGRIGVGWAAVRGLGPGGGGPVLTVADVDGAIDALSTTHGPGSQATRRDVLQAMFDRATSPEADLLARLLVGEVRTGALAGIVTDAVALASGVKLADVRRAVMLTGDLGAVARMAVVDGAEAVQAVGLEPMRPVQPMLASTADSVVAAVEDLGEVSVEWKLDGARIQVHRSGDRIRIWTRNLNEVTERLPEVVEVVRSFDARSFVLDGEVLGFMGGDASPQAFQDTMSRFGRDDAASTTTVLVPHFFDILHLDGVDQIDAPLTERLARLRHLTGAHAVPGIITTDPVAAEEVLAEALRRGHEGVMVKGAGGRYEAGRRGKSWRKVKPVHTLDLVVLAVEWGHGRRQGWLSNLHLGALDPVTGEAVMVGKTFKGLTDELLQWQTERFLELEIRRTTHTVWVEPVQVIEIALDGAQASTRYPGGVALRFARVKGYRADKTAAEADTLTAVRALLPGARR